MVIGTYRDQALDRNPGLPDTLEELIRMGIRPIKLQGLSENDVAQVIRSLSSQDPPVRLVKIFYEETQGNPFFVEEVFRHLVEEGKLLIRQERFVLIFPSKILTSPTAYGWCSAAGWNG